MTNFRIIEIFYNSKSEQQNNRAEIYTQAGKLSYFLVILKEIIVRFITSNLA